MKELFLTKNPIWISKLLVRIRRFEKQFEVKFTISTMTETKNEVVEENPATTKVQYVPKVRISTGINTHRIFVDDLLHLSISKPDLVAVQSYKDSKNEYWIEYVMARGPVVETSYENKLLWEEILKQLSTII